MRSNVWGHQAERMNSVEAYNDAGNAVNFKNFLLMNTFPFSMGYGWSGKVPPGVLDTDA
jgi:hypothetical protein